MNPKLAEPKDPAKPAPEETSVPSHPESALGARSGLRTSQLADRLFRYAMLACGLSVIAIVVLIVFELFQGSRLAINQFGFKFFIGSDWDPVSGEFGALPFVY